MKAVIQRVSQASVSIDGHVVGRIGNGLLVLICAEATDTESTSDRLLAKLLKLRIFSDEAGKMNRSIQDVEGGLLIVSQFTLAADVWSGNRPGFSGAADPETGERLYNHFVQAARKLHPIVETGVFGADMQVNLTNDGPVTIPIQL
ncbi:D-tyrosyl-tRNA(Tyr) deacylase [Pusillimonas sp. MFBS29]|uniref:D-aminoacyl-tRNA deacylase n=1 Tax=Pusillimonas sp. MFBS29 TaxID=2886690 RepID=UPI001D13001D|nr:D-aminoacyl-tRNA deacylase [Pusillimonas sp. MFBS29]MCC2596979.1 D-tyrosyl-tRNA(Tyr) deacylase [Pusillimonas sp. MFBS29]